MLGLAHDEVPGPVIFRLLNDSGDTEVMVGAPTGQPDIQQALGTEEIEEETNFLLQVAHAPGEDKAFFYDLVPLDGDKSQPPQEQQDQSDGEGDEQDEEQPEEEGEGDEQEQEEEQPQEQPEEAEPQSEGDEEKESVEEILENLEEGDDNFQLKRALEDLPERYIENDW